MQIFQNATFFLVEAVLSFMLYVVLIRFWMQWVKANFRNELGQFIITVTNPAVLPLRRVIPSIGTIDSATLILAYLIGLLKVVALVSLGSGGASISANFLVLLFVALGVLLQACIYLCIAAIFISVIASWAAPQSYHPILMVCRSIAEPLLAPARRLIPPIGGLDLSPIIVLVLLQFLARLILPFFGLR